MHDSEIDELNIAFSTQDTHKSIPLLISQVSSLHTPKKKRGFRFTQAPQPFIHVGPPEI